MLSTKELLTLAAELEPVGQFARWRYYVKPIAYKVSKAFEWLPLDDGTIRYGWQCSLA